MSRLPVQPGVRGEPLLHGGDRREKLFSTQTMPKWALSIIRYFLRGPFKYLLRIVALLDEDAADSAGGGLIAPLFFLSLSLFHGQRTVT